MDYKSKKAYRERSQGWRSRLPSKDVPEGNRSKFGYPISRSDTSELRAILKKETTRSKHLRKPTMPAMPWDNEK